MSIKVMGNYPSIDHVTTGIYSMDIALGARGKPGMPLRTMYEVFGHEHQGKSTLAYFMTAAIPDNGKITMCDIEGFDKDYAVMCMEKAKFNGVLQIISPYVEEKKKRTTRHHSEMMDELLNIQELEPDCNASIVDSIGAVMPIAEFEGQLEEAIMGRRAILVSSFARKMATTLTAKEEAGICVVVNHQHQVIGGRGHLTPGGVVLKHLSASRITVWSKETITTGKDADERILGHHMICTSEKLRYGGKGRKFSVINLSGIGIDRNMSAVFDCFVYKLASRDASVKIGKTSIARLSSLFDWAAEGKDEKFEPFKNELQTYAYSRHSADEFQDEELDDPTESEDGEVEAIGSDSEAVDE